MQATESNERQEFLARRRGFIGGSDAPKIVGVSRWGGPLEVYADKLGLVEPDKREEEYLEIGLVMEPYVANRYARETGCEVIHASSLAYRGLTIHPKHTFMGCHLDAYVIHPTKGRGVLQIKCTGFRGDEWEEGAPLSVQVQMQHEMECAQVDWGVAGVFVGAPMHVEFFEYERSAPFVDQLVSDESDFWGHVKTRTEPPASALDTRTLKRLYPGVTKEEIELPPEARDWHVAYVKGAAMEKEGKAAKDQAKVSILQSLGDAYRGKLPDGLGYWRRAVIERKGYTVEPTSDVDCRHTKKG